jgi:hypothetical protein
MLCGLFKQDKNTWLQIKFINITGFSRIVFCPELKNNPAKTRL